MKWRKDSGSVEVKKKKKRVCEVWESKEVMWTKFKSLDLNLSEKIYI